MKRGRETDSCSGLRLTELQAKKKWPEKAVFAARAGTITLARFPAIVETENGPATSRQHDGEGVERNRSTHSPAIDRPTVEIVDPPRRTPHRTGRRGHEGASRTPSRERRDAEEHASKGEDEAFHYLVYPSRAIGIANISAAFPAHGVGAGWLTENRARGRKRRGHLTTSRRRHYAVPFI